tara:strand:- start:243 stop:788 length:546 start_codon:yes stop_codon:yes gene_type:complete
MTFQKISLPINTLVCSDAFGLGFTISRVQRTSACKQGKVDVAFDDDLDVDADDFTGRVRTTVDAEGVTTVQRYRTVIVSYLDWDTEDEAEEIITPTVISDTEEAEVSEVDEIGFDNVEAIEAAQDAEEQEDEEIISFSRLPRGKVFSYQPKLTKPEVTETAESDDEEDDAGYADFLANEFE